jgi:hypothetical protein
MKNFILLFLISLSLSSCARWDLSKPIDEETDKKNEGNLQPAMINFM